METHPTRCPDVRELEAFLLGQCADEQQEQLEGHVSSCAACAAQLHRLGTSDPLVANLRKAGAVPPPTSPELRRLIVALKECGRTSLHQETQPEPTASTPTLPQSGVTAATEGSYPFLAPAQNPDELGRFGPYRVLKLLGAGGMGLVFQAEEVQLGRLVALKVLRPHAALEEAAEERFLREARAAAQLRHDHIVAVYAVGKEQGVSFLAMEYLEGVSLAAHLQGGRALPQEEAVRIAIQIAEGLAAAHARGFVHRDIKPENIWLEDRGSRVADRGSNGSRFDLRSAIVDPGSSSARVKLLDFGLARQAAGAGLQQITHLGTIVGTPAFMSPEQARGEPADPRSDLFSLGSVLYRMATGSVPFEGPDIVSTLLAVVVQDAKAPCQVNPAITRPLSDLIVRLLEKDPAARPQSAREVAEALRRIDACPQTPRGAPAGTGKWRGLILTAVILLAALLPLAFLFGGTVLRFATNKGELLIEVNDPDIEVVVKQNDLRIVDRTRRREFILDAGDGVVEVYEKDGIGPLKTDRFTLNRGGKTTVTVTLAPPRPVDPKSAADPERAVAEWVLASGGGVAIGNDSAQESPVNKLEALPKTPFQLYQIEFGDSTDPPLIDDASLENLRRVQRLRVLILRCRQVTDAGLKRLTTIPGLRHLVHLYLDGTQVTSAGLAAVERFPELKILDLDHAPTITDAAIPPLRELPRLTYLRFCRTGVTDEGLGELRGMKLSYLGVLEDAAITDAGMEHLRNLQDLTSLALDGTAIGDAGLARLRPLVRLESLTIDRTRVTDAGLAHLARMPSLVNLSLRGLRLTKAGLAKLTDLKGLTGLHLSDTPVTDADLAVLRGLPALRDVSLDETAIGDAGLEHLKGLRRLHHLNLQKTRVTAAGMRSLREALPACEVEWDAPDSKDE